MTMPPMMDLREFRDGGYLSEVNRRILHPLGLALAVNFDDDGKATGMFVYDDRADPEGWRFGESIMEEVIAKAQLFQTEWEARRPVRFERLGYMVQPVTTEPPSRHIVPPWTDEQVTALNAWQQAGYVHPFTCGGDHTEHVSLVATEAGWACPEACGYTQDWAYEFMAEPLPPNPLAPPGE